MCDTDDTTTHVHTVTIFQPATRIFSLVALIAPFHRPAGADRSSIMRRPRRCFSSSPIRSMRVRTCACQAYACTSSARVPGGGGSWPHGGEGQARRRRDPTGPATAAAKGEEGKYLQYACCCRPAGLDAGRASMIHLLTSACVRVCAQLAKTRQGLCRAHMARPIRECAFASCSFHGCVYVIITGQSPLKQLIILV